MVDLADDDIETALQRGAIAMREPRAIAAHFDSDSGRIIVDLTNGCVFEFPADLVEGLQNVSSADIAAVELLGAGTGLHWETLDIDISVQGLLAGIFGTRAHMARIAGSVASPRKAQSSRTNGAKGGRPRKKAEIPVS
jgi:hypothetical protein